jgi:L-alanine-DL-glutamate epimerase-like enolase superfamily enzyme
MILEARALHIPLTTDVSHAGAQYTMTDAILVQVLGRAGHQGLGEGCPRPYVTGETTPAALEWIRTNRSRLESDIQTFDDLAEWSRTHQAEIEQHRAAWCAIEIAMLDLLASRESQTVEELLGLPVVEGDFTYSAVLGAASSRGFRRSLRLYRWAGMSDFKLKLTGDAARDHARLRMLTARSHDDAPLSVRGDANNLWTDEVTAIRYLERLPVRLWAVEEPLRARCFRALASLSRQLDLPIVLDESCCSQQDLERALQEPGRWIPNIRVSKVGGLLRALELARFCVNHGLPFIIGSHVGETSVLARAALTVASAVREGLVAQEGAFGGFLLAWDPVRPTISFGYRGTLRVRRREGSVGMGLWPRLRPPWMASPAPLRSLVPVVLRRPGLVQL